MFDLDIVFKTLGVFSCELSILLSWLEFPAMCAFGFDFLLCPVPMCSCALPSEQAFVGLLQNSELWFGLEAEQSLVFVLGVDVKEEETENPAA